MDRIDLKALADAFGIHSPWTIKSAVVKPEEKQVEIHLALAEKKSFFTFRDGKSENQAGLVGGQWYYQPVGQYRSVIHAPVPSNLAGPDSGLTRSLISQLAFLGSPKSCYSNYLRQQVAMAQIKGVDLSLLSELMLIPKSEIESICEDLEKTSSQVKPLASLPTEIDPAWSAIVQNKMSLKTDVLPLKFLLSKLQRISAPSAEALKAQVVELRKFFIENASILEQEIEQVSGINTQQQKRQVKAAQTSQRLVLPPLKSSVWLELLSGKIQLNSSSVPLNLLISRQRSAFISGKSTNDKIQAIETLRAYFRKNCRGLKTELVLLNRAMAARQKSSLALPNSDHAVWQKLLSNDDFLSSDNMAYKLLLAKLKAQISQGGDPVIKIEAANKVREFLKQNQKTMKKELNALVKQSAAM